MTKNREQQPSRIPQLSSREEEARWFDTHDMADYQDEFKPVKARFAKNLSKGITIRLDQDTLEALRAYAHERGLGPTTVIRMWVLERLKEQRQASSEQHPQPRPPHQRSAPGAA
ncbi:MAG: hypothetical protein HY675_06830 [Chloroflexi bacterium]|nr:hypothetical protein [Chloroflexota bacterium]